MKNNRSKHFTVKVTFGPLRTLRVFCCFAACREEAEAKAIAEAKRASLLRPSILCDAVESLDCVVSR